MRDDKIKYRFQLYLFADTKKAVLVGKTPECKRKKDFWLPKSQVDIIEQKRDGWDELVTLDIPQWLAERSGLDVTHDGEVIE